MKGWDAVNNKTQLFGSCSVEGYGYNRTSFGLFQDLDVWLS